MTDRKKCYSTPQLKVHGSVEQLTQQVIKSSGQNDVYAQAVLAPLTPSQLVGVI
ncbi:MAG: lasso peptide [Armatimonadota bacterium]